MKKTFLLGVACSVLLLSNTAFAEFNDIQKDNKYYKDIKYVENAKIFMGTSENIFSPNDNVTRAMMIQILYNMNKGIHYGQSYYADVETDKWYNKAITWSRVNNVASGRGNNIFDPNSLITKQELVTLLYNYAKYKEYDVSIDENINILSYEDALDIAEYAYIPFAWACREEIIENDGEELRCDSYVTRAEVAAIIKKFSMKYMKESVNVSIDGDDKTGFAWYPAKYDETIVFIENEGELTDDKDINAVGASGKVNFKVSALNAGKTRVIFEHRCSCGEKIDAIVCLAEVDRDGKLLFSQQPDASDNIITVKSNVYNRAVQENDCRIIRNRRDLILYILEFEITEEIIPEIENILSVYNDDFFYKNMIAVITKQETNENVQNRIYKVNAISDCELDVYINRTKSKEEATTGASWHMFIELDLEKYRNISKINVGINE